MRFWDFELFSSHCKHFLKISFSINESHHWPTGYCSKLCLMTSLTRNDRNCWFWEFFSFLSCITCDKIWSFLMEKISNKFYIAPLLGNIGAKFVEKYWNCEENNYSCEDTPTKFWNIFLLSVSLIIT